MLNIGIIGGSISGCIAAVLLMRAGHSVTVYERSRRGLVGRGGGLATSRTVFNQLRTDDLLDADFSASTFSVLKMAAWSAQHSHVEHCPLSLGIDMCCVNWSGLWENLRKRVPHDRYRRAMMLERACEHPNGQVKLIFANGQKCFVDLVVFADGYRSLGRKACFPDSDLSYRGYFVYRGTLPESCVSNTVPLDDHPRYSLKDINGSFVSFAIPDHEGKRDRGQRIINWAAYLPLAHEKLAQFMIDRDGARRDGSIPSGAMREDQDEALKKLLRDQVPPYYSDIIATSHGNQIQLIYTSALPAYHKGRMCLIGDAGMVVQPMTGSGLFKGYSNARDLVEALRSGGVCEKSLDRWSEEQVRVAGKMLDLGNEMEDAFIFKSLDLTKATPGQCRQWWEKSIHLPDEYSYFAA